MRQIAEELDTGNICSDRISGDPFFRTFCDKEYDRLIQLQMENKSHLGKVKIETPG